jgi:hypothetical protein
MNNCKAVIGIVALAIVGAISTPAAFAKQIDLGKHGQDEIRSACNKHGGELLGVSDSGSYGCEYADSGTLILCDKNSNCTGYTEARTPAQGNRIMNIAGIKGKAVVMKSGTGKPKPATDPTKPTNK